MCDMNALTIKQEVNSTREFNSVPGQANEIKIGVNCWDTSTADTFFWRKKPFSHHPTTGVVIQNFYM